MVAIASFIEIVDDGDAVNDKMTRCSVKYMYVHTSTLLSCARCCCVYGTR
jgi:hypothetical protein